MKTPPLLVKHDSPAGPYWYHPDHPDCQDGQVLWEEPTPPHTPESLLALTKSPEGLYELRYQAALADGYFEVERRGTKIVGVNPCLLKREHVPFYTTSLDAIFAAEERLGLHDPDAFGFREVWLRFAAFTIREDRGQCLTTNSVSFLPPPLRLIPFILTAQWKEQNP